MSQRSRYVSRSVLLSASVAIPLALSSEKFIHSPLAATGTAVLIAVGIWWRNRSTLSLASITAATFLAVATAQGLWPFFSVIVVAYLCGRLRPAGRAAWLLVGGTVTALAVLWALRIGGVDALTVFFALVVTVVLPWWVGSDARVRADLVDAGWERAERIERERQLVEATARQAERTRIATEMHDALGYELSVLVLTAGAGEVDPTSTPAQRAQFAQVRAAAMHAVGSLHDVLRLLREDEPPAEMAPDALETLVERYRAGGGKIEATFAVDTSSWPDALRRATYRMTQELLTNAAKHAHGLPLRLTVGSTEDSITVFASNPRSAASTGTTSSGSGLLGIGARARALGGTATTSQDPRVFEVLISIPLLTPEHASSSNSQWPSASESVSQTSPSRRLTKSRWRIAAVPLGALGAVVAALVAMNAITAESVGLPVAAFEHLEIGMKPAEYVPLLPPSHLEELPPVFTAPEAPADTTCRFYRASDNWLDLGNSYVRLCFADDILTSKERIG